MSKSFIQLGNEKTSGIKTEPILDNKPPGFKVRRIEWDSDFRQSGLSLGDLIIGIDNDDLETLLNPQKFSTGIGQYAEGSYWKDKMVQHGQSVTLHVLRDDESLKITGKIHAEYNYFDQNDKPSLGPGGPDKMARPSFSEWSWSSWHEKFTEKMYFLLNFAWVQNYDTRRELANHLDWKERIDFLLKTCPGPYADAMYRDWQQVLECLQGQRIDIISDDLQYREIGEKRVQITKEEALQTWKTFTNNLSPEMIEPYPAASVYDSKKVAGKVIELPRITFRDIVNGPRKSFAALGSPENGYYFAEYETPEMNRFFKAMYRYKAVVNPRMKDQYRYVGRIQDDSRLIAVGEKAFMGLTIQPLGIMAGEDECFVDLRTENPKFAGEDTLAQVNTVNLPNNASPGDVVKAMIDAIKLGDYLSWRELFVDWQIDEGKFGFTIVNRFYRVAEGVLYSHWEYSRLLILGEVFDARVSKVGKIRRILNKDIEKDLPRVDEVTVIVDHYGFFDGEYRSFGNAKVKRIWILQRLDEGPWKISSIQHL
jgi:hypothetical protein